MSKSSSICTPDVVKSFKKITVVSTNNTVGVTPTFDETGSIVYNLSVNSSILNVNNNNAITFSGAGTPLSKLQAQLVVSPNAGNALVLTPNGYFVPPGNGAGEINTAENTGTTGVGLFKQKLGVSLQFKKLIEGTGITLIPSLDGITINSAVGGGDITNGANVGSGVSVFKDKLTTNLRFRKLVPGTGILITENANDIAIESNIIPGEVNTASNLAVAGTVANVFKQKVGVDFQFRKLVQGTNITLTEGVSGITITSTGTGSSSLLGDL